MYSLEDRSQVITIGGMEHKLLFIPASDSCCIYTGIILTDLRFPRMSALSVHLISAHDGIAQIIKEFNSGTLTLGVDDIGLSAASELTGAETVHLISAHYRSFNAWCLEVDGFSLCFQIGSRNRKLHTV